MSTPTTPQDAPSKPHRPRGKELTPEMRARICELRSIGWSYRKIQERHSIPLSTIVSTIKREHDRVGQKSKPRSGAPKAITQEERDRMAEKLKLDPNITWKDLSKECENASVTTVRKLMSEFRPR